MKESLTVSVFSVGENIPDTECDYVSLSVADSVKGSFSGQYGIKKGHTNAVFALCQGRITAKRASVNVLDITVSSGFAFVSDNKVKITVDSILSKN